MKNPRDWLTARRRVRFDREHSRSHDRARRFMSEHPREVAALAHALDEIEQLQKRPPQ